MNSSYFSFTAYKNHRYRISLKNSSEQFRRQDWPESEDENEDSVLLKVQ